MMQQAYDGLDVQLVYQIHASVRPGPVCGPGSHHLFPQYGLTERLDSKVCKQPDVVYTFAMPTAFELTEILVSDAIDRAFDAAPDLQRWGNWPVLSAIRAH